jgi:hypothetical protein
MKLDFKKINLDRVKEFLFNHGEKVGLGTCVFLALMFGLFGWLRASSSATDGKGKTWDKALQARIDEIDNGIKAAPSVPLTDEQKAALDPSFYIWVSWIPKFIATHYIPTGDQNFDKRENPQLLTVLGGKEFQLDYVSGIVLGYETTEPTEGMGVKALDVGGAPPAGDKLAGKPEKRGMGILPMCKPMPRRMVVGTAVFPMKQQFERYLSSLRMKSQKELLIDNRDDLPRPLGFSVLRFEVKPDGKLSDPVEIIAYDKENPKDHARMTKGLQELLRTALYDEKAAAQQLPYLYDGLDMPMPRLANAVYPPVKSLGLAFTNDTRDLRPAAAGGANPPKNGGGGGIKIIGKGPPAGPGPAPVPGPAMAKMVTIMKKDVQDADPDLASRLFGEGFNPFHVLGKSIPQAAAPDAKLPPQGLPGNQPPLEGAYFSGFADAKIEMPPAGKEDRLKWNYNALVRFVDPDVEPGKVYKYAIQVRFRNPNFEKQGKVQFNDLASAFELKLPANSWVMSEDAIAIPQEYYIYALDQDLLDNWAGSGKKLVGDPRKKDHTTFQIHQWISTKLDGAGVEHNIGDWVIAERIEVRKGEYIGLNVPVPVLAWDKTKNEFVKPDAVPVKKGKKVEMAPGILMNFMPPLPPKGNVLENMPPILVDFHGGRRLKGTQIEEETAVDALILGADGRLMIFNSRDDSDGSRPEGNRRQERLDRARKRLQ